MSEGKWRQDRTNGYEVRIALRKEAWREHMTDYKTWRESLGLPEAQTIVVKQFIGGMSPDSTVNKALNKTRKALASGISATTLLKISLVLLEEGADVDSRNPSQPYEPLIVVVTHVGRCDLMEMIHSEGGDLNAKDSNGLTGLQHAVANHNFICVWRLLTIGVEVQSDWLLKVHNVDSKHFTKKDRETFIQKIHEFMDYMERFHKELQLLMISRKVHTFSEFLLRFSFDVKNIEALWSQMQAEWDISCLQRPRRNCIIS